MKLLLSFQFLILALPAFALIHKRTQYFIDIELPKNQVLIDCSDHPRNNTSYLSFNFLHKDDYYFFYYRRPLSIRLCHEQKEEYIKMIQEGQFVRVVGIKPEVELMKDSERMKYPASFNKAKKSISATFIRLQANNRCKAYFADDCELPKNYWGGVIPEE